MASKLFTPFKLDALELSNRIVVAPMCQYSAHEGTVSDWHLMHLGQFAVSGASLVFVEASGVEAVGRISPGCPGLYNDENEAGMARIVKFFKDYGSAKIGIRLAHAGRKASMDYPRKVARLWFRATVAGRRLHLRRARMHRDGPSRRLCSPKVWNG